VNGDEHLKPATISLAAVRAMLDAMEAYVPYAQRENARAHALAVSIGYAYPPPKAMGHFEE
jgi:hypothetical protein